ncbi:MAG: ASCH domain-containing protein [Nitrospirae bacterium]|nr:ASCH domain-containing protein [Nitrospirota bacterium]
MKPLILHLKREYWEAIRNGSKTEEYRTCNDYWGLRLHNREYTEIHLLLGYPKKGDTSRILRKKWKGYKKTVISHKHFGNCVLVFAIDISVDA